MLRSLEPVPLVSIALGKAGRLSNGAVPGGVAWLSCEGKVKEMRNCICFECWSLFMGKGLQ